MKYIGKTDNRIKTFISNKETSLRLSSMPRVNKAGNSEDMINGKI